MATIGALRIEMSAKIDKLQRDLNKARGEIARSTQHMKRMGDQAQRASVSSARAFSRMSVGASGLTTRLVATSRAMQHLAVIAGAAITTGFVARTIAATDATGKMAARLGVTAEFLQEMRFAASQSGVALSSLETGMQRIIRRSQDAADGNRQLELAFRRVGLSLEDLQRLSNEEIFRRSIAGAARLENGLAALQKIADTEGVALLNMGRQGDQGLRLLQQRARSLGLVLSNETVRAAENANDQLDIMSRVIRVQLTRAALQLSPHIIQLGESFARITTAVVQGVDAVSSLTDREAAIVDSINNIGNAFRNMGGVLLSITDFLAKLDKFAAKYQQFTPFGRGQALTPEFDRILKALGLSPGGTPEMAIAGKMQPPPPVTLPGRTVRATAIPTMPFDRELGPATQQMQALLDVATQIEQKVREGFGPDDLAQKAQQYIEQFRTPFEIFQRTRTELEAIRAEVGERFQPTFERAMQAAEMAYKRTTAAGRILQGVGQGITDAFNTALNGVIQGTQSVSEAFKNMFRNILLSIGKLLVQFAVLQGVLLALSVIPGGTAVLKAMDAAALAGSVGQGVQTALQSRQGGQVQGLQHGGIVTRPTLAMLGENPAKNPEYVLNRQQMEGMGREVNVILVDDRMSAEQLAAQLPNAIIRVVSDQINNGPGTPINAALRNVYARRRG